MLKKLFSLLLSLLLCLSLLSGQVFATDAPEDNEPVQTETSETGQPNHPDELIMPAIEEFPGEKGADFSDD